MDIGNQLRNLLEQDGITQKQLAEALNISTTTDYIYGLTTLREPMVSPYNAEERHLVNIYRGIPEDKKPLYIETGRTFSKFGKPKKKKI